MSKKNNKKETRCWDFFLPTDHNDGSQSADIGMGDNALDDRSNEAIFEVDADHDDCDCDCWFNFDVKTQTIFLILYKKEYMRTLYAFLWNSIEPKKKHKT